jgi:DegV family protein with EDD domain
MVTIVADTTSSLPKTKFPELGIPLLPQIIVFGDKEYRDDTELDTNGFMQKLRSSDILPKTAAPAPALYAPIYKKYTENGGSVIVIVPSAEVSGTFRSASVAAEDFPNADIRVIDSRTVAGGLGSLVLQAHSWAQQGMDSAEVERKVKNLASREHVYFLVDTLEYLRKGGRIGGAQAMVGSILQVKPILTIKNGKAEPVDSQRTKKKALARLMEIVLTDCPRDRSALVSVMHCEAEADARDLKKQLEETLGITDIPIYELPPAIIVHVGPKALAVSYFVKE